MRDFINQITLIQHPSTVKQLKEALLEIMTQTNTDLRRQTLLKNANKKKNSSIEFVASDEEISFINPSDLSLDTPPKYHVNTSMFNGSLSPVKLSPCSNDDNSFDDLPSSPDVPHGSTINSSTSSSPQGSPSSSAQGSLSSSPQGSPSSSPWKANNYSSSPNDSPRSPWKPNSPSYGFNYEDESPNSPSGYPWLSPARMQGDADEFDLDLDMPKPKKMKN